MTSETRWMISQQWMLLLFLLASGYVLGGFLGLGLEAVIVTLLGFFLWHFWQFVKLYDWLSDGRKKSVPEAGGPWYRIFDELHRWRRRARKDRKRFLDIIEEFRTSTEALADAVVILSPDNAIMWANQAAKELLGIDRRYDAGTRITHLLRTPEFVQYMQREAFEEPFEMSAPAMPDKRLSIQVTPYLQGQKLVVAQDVTRLHRLEQIRRDFVANVSHELRTPLTVLNGYLELLSSHDRLSTDQMAQVVHNMTAQAKRMQAIVEDLLHLARLEKSGAARPVSGWDVTSALAQVKQEALALSDGKHDIRLQIKGKTRVRIEERDIYKICSNLVSNAVRYTPAGGRIDLIWEADSAGGNFSVRDTGPGISSTDIPRLTERFFRVDDGRSRDTGGTGLG
ncbi:MAG: phosphate regulon sensor histidine kinase PhoR, partial [Gammaproteobacteria bacterium]